MSTTSNNSESAVAATSTPEVTTNSYEGYEYVCGVICCNIKDKRFNFFSSKPSTFVEITIDYNDSVKTHVVHKKLSPKWKNNFQLIILPASNVKFALVECKGPNMYHVLGSLSVNGSTIYNCCNENKLKYKTILTLVPEGDNASTKNYGTTLQLHFKFVKSMTCSNSAANALLDLSNLSLTDTITSDGAGTSNAANQQPTTSTHSLSAVTNVTTTTTNNSRESQTQSDSTPSYTNSINHPNNQNSDEQIPAGWEVRYTVEGRPYYVDHNTSSTSWDRPMPLPLGWERRVDDHGRTYYVDHNTQTTSWQRPTAERIQNYNRFVTSRTCERNTERERFQQRFLYGDSSSNNNTESSLSQNSATTTAQHHRSTNSILSRGTTNSLETESTTHQENFDLLGPLPEGWEKRLDKRSNRFYYVDHVSEKTTWNDPRLKWLVSEINPLPSGWGIKVNDIGIPYFVCHTNRSTTYNDPRTGISLFPSTSLSLQRTKPFKEKSIYFQHLCHLHLQSGNIKIGINRNSMFEDSFEQIMRYPPQDLRRKLFIQIKGEAGLDYGGVAREWFFELSHEIMNPMYCLFEYTDPTADYIIRINPSSSVNPNHLMYFKFIGRILALSLFHGRLMDRGFSSVFYKQLLNRKCTFNDLEKLDNEFYNSLVFVKDNDVEECDLDLYFCMESIKLGTLTVVDLKADGRNIPVTNENKEEYVRLVADWRLTREIEEQMNAVVTGFSEIFPPTWLIGFDEMELELMLCGMQVYDIGDWKLNTRFKNGYTRNTKQVLWFWKFVESLEYDKQARLLQFITGTCRIPVGGFSELIGSNGIQTFCIEKWGTANDLPRSHTCFNRLDLPPYPNEETLRSKLLLAITETSGFHDE